LEKAPPAIREFSKEFALLAESVEVTPAAISLQEAYLHANVLTTGSRMDALHVAIAVVAGCPLIVSWNFKHIVNFRKIPLYNGVNLLNGYMAIAICSPPEVIEDESGETV